LNHATHHPSNPCEQVCQHRHQKAFDKGQETLLLYGGCFLEHTLSKRSILGVRQAYDDLLQGALKAELLRCFVLLIHDGLYADVDIVLESNLDVTVRPDVGFFAPFDCMVHH
jgi:hypothetical protein